MLMKEFLERFKSPALWTSMAALIVYCIKSCFGIDLADNIDAFINVLLPVLVGFGIVNNPTDKHNI